jgi:tetratricopeptide (TPR) repeat protein
MLRQAREEIRKFETADGLRSDAQHPVEKWVPILWSIHERAPQSSDGAKAASEAVHLLIHADRFDEAYGWADRVAAGDAAWETLSGVLVEAAGLQKNDSRSLQKLQSVLPSAHNPKAQAAIQVSLGQLWLSRKEEAKAKAAFEAAIESAAESRSGLQAQSLLYEMLHLGPGQPAPLFSFPTMAGPTLSLADLRDKPVVIVFWAST